MRKRGKQGEVCEKRSTGRGELGEGKEDKVLFKKVKSSRKTDRQRGPGGGINLNFRLS